MRSFPLCSAASLLLAASAAAAPTPTKVVEFDGAYHLLRNGEPYKIKGVGGTSRLEELAAAGANSLRTWGVDGTTRPLLDEAHRLGLTVTVGLWMEHERHGHSYDDRAFVEAQQEEMLGHVRDLMDHPAVLMWGVGNEMEGEGDRPVIYEAVNAAAAAIKKIDPLHPTMTVIAELGPGNVKAEAIRDRCPAIDVVGINSYGGISSVGERYRQVGLEKPFVVTEHGPLGHWEVGKTAWGTPIEQTSTEKAAFYRNGYEAVVEEHADLCLGTYAFLWGEKQETTATWYGMYLTDGSRTGAADAMQELWSGSPPQNRVPVIDALSLEGPQVVEPGSLFAARLDASDPEGDPLGVEWVFRVASAGDGVGGDAEERTDDLPEAIVVSSNDSAAVRAPDKPGKYRLFAYVRDDAGGAATANVPVLVKDTPAPVTGGGADLPVRVDPEDAAPPWTPSGFMGNTDAVSLEPSTDDPHSGDACLAAAYTASTGWGGVVWQHPADDWGDAPGGHDLRPATRLAFFARGADGGEEVKFGLGVIGSEKPHPDSGSAERVITLTDEWERYELDLTGVDLSNIKTGFLFAVAGQGRPVRFFLDDIRYE